MLFKISLRALMAILILLSSTTAFSETAAQVIDVKAPVIDSQITKGDTAQVFMELKNNGIANYELIAATSPAATKIQFHEPNNNAAGMHVVRNISLLKNTEKDFQLDGLHVMLIGLKKSLVPGETVPLTLIYSDGSWVTINATVN